MKLTKVRTGAFSLFTMKASLVIHFFLLCLGLLLATAAPAAEIKLPKGMTRYIPLEQKEIVAGEILANGSSRVGPIIHSVLEAFTVFYPQVQFKVTQDGSGSAIPALLERQINIGLMSRRISTEEINAFIDRKGYPPTELHLASDALRIIVNRHNPMNQISLIELEAIFSEERLCGAKYSIDVWEDFGWVANPETTSNAFSSIRRHIWMDGTGTRGFFKSKVLCGGEFKEWSIESARTTEEIMQEVALSFVENGNIYAYMDERGAHCTDAASVYKPGERRRRQRRAPQAVCRLLWN